MKWVFLFLTLSMAVSVLAVFSTPVQVRVQLSLNRKQTLARVSLGIINGLIWFTVYRAQNTVESEEHDQGELIIESLEGLIRHPENAYGLFRRFISGIAESKPHQDVSEDILEKPETPRDRFIKPIITQALKEGLTIIHLRVHLIFGAGDAATTGIVLGLIHSLLGTAMAVFSNRLRFPRNLPEITILPCYNEVRVDMEIDSIILLSPSLVIFPAVFGRN